MNTAMREAELLVWLQQYPAQAAELNRRGNVKAAIELVAMVENMAAELKMVMAHRANATRS
jgi:hypothetical protein